MVRRIEYNLLPAMKIREDEIKEFSKENNVDIPPFAIINESMFNQYSIVKSSVASNIFSIFERDEEEMENIIYNVHPWLFSKLYKYSPENFKDSFLSLISKEQLSGVVHKNILKKFSLHQLEILQDRFKEDSEEMVYEACYYPRVEGKNRLEMDVKHDVGLLEITGKPLIEYINKNIELVKKQKTMDKDREKLFAGKAVTDASFNIIFNLNDESYIQSNRITSAALMKYLTIVSHLKVRTLCSEYNIDNYKDSFTIYHSRKDLLKMMNSMYTRIFNTQTQKSTETNLGKFKEFPLIYTKEEVSRLLNIPLNQLSGIIRRGLDNGLYFFRIGKSEGVRTFRYRIEDIENYIEYERSKKRTYKRKL